MKPDQLQNVIQGQQVDALDAEIEDILSSLPYEMEFGELKLEQAALNCMGI